MADNEDSKENTSREWEMVSLTASTYAAAPAPGPTDVEMKDDEEDNTLEEEVTETSHALFMSGHFVFPPSQHENLPLEPDNSEVLGEHAGKNVVSEVSEEGDKSGGKDGENSMVKGLSVIEEFPGIQFFDEKGHGLSMSGKEFEESTTLQDLNVSDKEQSMYSTTSFSSYHDVTGLGGLNSYGENLGIPDVHESSDRGLDFPVEASQSPETAKDGEDNGSNLPCEAWWKRRAASLCAHAKEANAFWSIFIAAAVVGLVILGQRWQPEKWQVLQLKWQFSINNEKNRRIVGPIHRLKDAIVGGHRRGSFIRGSSSGEN